MHSQTASAVAWVESPLQLLCAVEYAAASGTAIEIVARTGGLQLERTAARLRELGLPEGTTISESTAVNFFVRAVSRLQHWVIGDAFSGVVRAVLCARRPERVTIVDDGSTSLLVPAVLSGTVPLTRPGVEPAPLAGRARTRLRNLAQSARLELFSMYELESELDSENVSVSSNNFSWLRSRGLQPEHGPHVILGSAAVVDGGMTSADYLDWVRSQPRPTTYFPHRRETAAHLGFVNKIEGVVIHNTGLPIEMTLAGAKNLQIRSLASSATRSLDIILQDSGCSIQVETLTELPVHS